MPRSGIRRVEVGNGAAGADPRDLARDVGRTGREEEPQARAEPALGTRRDVEELGGRAAAKLLAGGAHEPLQGTLGGRRSGVGAVLGRGADDDQPAGRDDPPDRRMEEGPELTQLAAGGDAGGVEDEPLPALLARRLGIPDPGIDRRGPERRPDLVVEAAVDARVRTGEHLRDRRTEPAVAGRPDQHAAVDQGPAGVEAVELDRLRQPEVAGDEGADRVVDELGVGVGHRALPVPAVSRPRGSRRRPGRRPRRSRSGRGPSRARPAASPGCRRSCRPSPRTGDRPPAIRP